MMGKNSRKRKKKEEDFKKVKLKVGKTRPAGENETTTSFKSRAIVIPSQDTKTESGPTNVRKQGLKDLLSQLSHYNSNIRQEALLGLRSLFQQHEGILHEHLGTVVEKIAEKVTDTEASVRHSLLLLLRHILPLIPPERIAPFLPLVSAHLSCAMTHIIEDIQLESLGILGLLLEYFPNQMILSSSQLLDNFIGLITHQGHGGSKPAKHGSSSLVVNPKGKLSSQKSRLKVLNQLLEYLRALYLPETDNNKEQRLKVTFSEKIPTHVQIFDDMDNLEMYVLKSPSSVVQSSSINTACLKKDFIGRIVPLLVDCWIESNPAEMSTSLPSSSISPVAFSTMTTVVDILKVLLETFWSQTTNFGDSDGAWMYSNYFKDFNHHFLSFFPFAVPCQPSKKRKAKTIDQTTGMSVMNLNITICEVMSFFLECKCENSRAWITNLEEFVVHALTSNLSLYVEQVKSLLKFVRRDFYTKHVMTDSMLNLVGALVKLYKASHHLSATKKVLLLFLGELMFSNCSSLVSRQELLQHDAVHRWLCSLPALLNQLKASSPDMTRSVLLVLSSVMTQEPAELDLSILNKQLTAFFSCGTFFCLDVDIQRSAVQLLFRMGSLETSLIHALVECCHCPKVSTETVHYLLGILHCRSPLYEGVTGAKPAMSVSTFLSVLFSASIGISSSELQRLQTSLNPQVRCFFELVYDENQASSWARHKQILQATCSLYRQCRHCEKLLEMVESALQRTLNLQVIPLTAACSIIRLVCCLGDLCGASDSGLHGQLHQSLTELVFSCFVYLAGLPWAEVATEIRKDATQLLTLYPSIMQQLITLMHNKLKDMPSEISWITTCLLQTDKLSPILIACFDSLDKLITSVKELKDVLQPQVLADLSYQHHILSTENRRHAHLAET